MFAQVFAGSPADGELHRGDQIVAVENYDASEMFHKQAQELIKKSGGSISLRIRRYVCFILSGLLACSSMHACAFTLCERQGSSAVHITRMQCIEMKL